MNQLKFRFDGHGLGDVCHFALAIQLYRRRGYEVTVQIEENKRFLWQVAGVNIVQGGDLPEHSYGYSFGFDDLSLPDFEHNKVAFGLRSPVLPPLSALGLSAETAWDELCNVRLSAKQFISAEAYKRADRFLEGLPRPIICFHSRGTNWAEQKSIPTDIAFDTILELLDATDGSVVVLDFDRRAPMVGDVRCKGIKPYWGHISIEQQCAIFERSDLIIGIDSGPFHLASFTSTKALGVFRSIHPVRCCLPNPNSIYLASALLEDHWSSRRDKWNIATFCGIEPSANEIAMNAIEILNGHTLKESHLSPNEFAGLYDYHRMGHDKRIMELRQDGTIGTGAGDCEKQWFVRRESDGLRIAISGKHGIICDCLFDSVDGIWKGRWTHFERMPVRLISLNSKELRHDCSRIMVVMNWDDTYKEISAIVEQNRREFANRHGYQIHKSSYSGPWGKINSMLEVWDHADWLWWLDGDACVTNLDYKLENLISSEAWVIATCDHNGINSGSMLIKTVREVRLIFEDALKRRSEFDWPNNLCEQNALMWMFWKIKEHVLILSQQAMNSYPDFDCPKGAHRWVEGDFVMHCAGLRFPKRVELLRNAINRVRESTNRLDSE